METFNKILTPTLDEFEQATSSCSCRLLRYVDKGASAIVYEELYRNRDPTGFALKVFEDPEVCNTEYKILKDLQHDNIVQCVGEPCIVGGKGFFRLEMMMKGSLDKLYTRGKLEGFQVNFFVLQLLKAVSYLHRRDMVHRDIKGPNCLIGPDYTLKLADFEKAVKVTDGLVTKGGIWPDKWTAPEVYMVQQGATYDGKQADIWRVGCTWVEMLNGDGEFLGHGSLYVNGKIPAIPRTIPEAAAELIGRMLNQDPLMRPTADDLLKEDYFQSVEEEYCKNLNEGKKKGVQNVNEEESKGAKTIIQSVENLSEESENMGVLIFDLGEPSAPFLEDDAAVILPSSSDGREKQGRHSWDKVWTFDEVFKVSTRCRHKECTNPRSLLDMGYRLQIKEEIS